MRSPKYQFFTLEEYQGRLDALRRRMEERGIDVLLVNSPENLYYLSGYQTPGYYWYQTLIVTMDREPVFITRLNEESNMRTSILGRGQPALRRPRRLDSPHPGRGDGPGQGGCAYWGAV